MHFESKRDKIMVYYKKTPTNVIKFFLITIFYISCLISSIWDIIKWSIPSDSQGNILTWLPKHFVDMSYFMINIHLPSPESLIDRIASITIYYLVQRWRKTNQTYGRFIMTSNLGIQMFLYTWLAIIKRLSNCCIIVLNRPIRILSNI